MALIHARVDSVCALKPMNKMGLLGRMACAATVSNASVSWPGRDFQSPARMARVAWPPQLIHRSHYANVATRVIFSDPLPCVSMSRQTFNTRSSRIIRCRGKRFALIWERRAKAIYRQYLLNFSVSDLNKIRRAHRVCILSNGSRYRR